MTPGQWRRLIASARRALARGFLLCCLFLGPLHTADAGSSPAPSGHDPLAPAAALGQPDAPFVPGEILVGWQPDAGPPPDQAAAKRALEDRNSPAWARAVASLAQRSGLPVLDAHPAYGLARLATARGREQAEIARLQRLSWVKYAEPNYRARAALAPTDPYYPQEWNLQRVAAAGAWDLTTGSPSLAVAVIDSGIDMGHPEFTDRLLVGLNYLDPAHPSYPSDDFGHGTHVAGIIAAAANGIGVVGLAPDIKILPIKVLDAQGNGTFANIAAAIYWATDYPGPVRVRVLNLSLGAYAQSQAIAEAVSYAVAHDVLVVAAGGNDAQGQNRDFYPGASPGAFAVAATDRNDQWAPYSNHKPYIALAAPGGLQTDQILSTLPYRVNVSGYGYEFGTSMSAPLVAAAAALAWTIQPAAHATDIGQILQSTADRVGDPAGYDLSGHSDYFGSGRLNAARAVRYAYPPSLTPARDRVAFLLDGVTTQGTTSVTLDNPSEHLVTWQAAVSQGGDWLSVTPGPGQLGSSTFSVPGVLLLTARVGQLPPGYYTTTVEIRTVYGPPASLSIEADMVVVQALRHTALPFLAR